MNKQEKAKFVLQMFQCMWEAYLSDDATKEMFNSSSEIADNYHMAHKYICKMLEKKINPKKNTIDNQLHRLDELWEMYIDAYESINLNDCDSESSLEWYGYHQSRIHGDMELE